jgi:hypothetical protein
MELPELPEAAHTVWDDYYEGYVLSPTPQDRYHNGAVLLYSEHQMREYGRACALVERERAAKLCGDIALAMEPEAVSVGAYRCAAALRSKTTMDAVAKHIHGSEAFSFESVARAVNEAAAKKETTI